jgi:dipeptidyl aminopeptidase/acylaminoacyl peptidase
VPCNPSAPLLCGAAGHYEPLALAGVFNPQPSIYNRQSISPQEKSLRHFTLLLVILALPVSAQLQPSDLYHLRSVTDAAFSPDSNHIAYVVQNNDGPGRPYDQIWIMDLRSGKSLQLTAGADTSSNPEWSPSGEWLAYNGNSAGKSGLFIAHPDGSGIRFLAPVENSNSPEPHVGRTLAWSPDSRQIAFVSAQPGPETKDAGGDPVVITRYLYKPDYWEGNSHFNDNRRLHIFVVDVASAKVRQLTQGTGYEHSIDWSPDGKGILYAAEHGPDADRFFNYDLFTARLSDGAIHQLTSTEGVEYYPRWSPDGSMIAFAATKRGLTDRETNMEDTHVWVMNADGSHRREIGALVDNRQGAPQWAPDGSAVYFTVQDRGNDRLYRLPINGAAPQVVIGETGSVGAFSPGKNGAIAYTFATSSDLSELYLRPDSAGTARKLTKLNRQVLGGRQLAPVESFTFLSNDFKFDVEAFLTKPVGFTAGRKYPLILNIHGGPHGQQGPELNFRNQVYAAHGYAVLNVNYRGSTGYGQKFADAVFRDQDGDEAMDVLYGVNAALRRYPWIDRDRMGIEGVSYGGQLTDWLITQTNIFKAAIPVAGITNFISYNYMTYYNQYEAMEWGAYPHQDNLMDVLWERSPLKHVANVSTPTMFLHGENDPDVPIAEAEQMYIALKDVGVETVFVRYPREGHGLREPKHQVDSMERAFAWYDRHFSSPQPKSTPAIP